MRRTLLIVVATALVTSALTSVTVAAATGGGERRPAAPRDQDGTLGTSLPVIVDTKVNCGTPPPGRDWRNQDALEKTIRCLEDEIINVNRFMKAFFRCARIVPVTQYGEDPNGGTFGYLWTSDGVNVFLTTALDFTIDPTVEPFNYFMVWQNTTFCTT